MVNDYNFMHEFLIIWNIIFMKFKCKESNNDWTKLISEDGWLSKLYKKNIQAEDTLEHIIRI